VLAVVLRPGTCQVGASERALRGPQLDAVAGDREENEESGRGGWRPSEGEAGGRPSEREEGGGPQRERQGEALRRRGGWRPSEGEEGGRPSEGEEGDAGRRGGEPREDAGR